MKVGDNLLTNGFFLEKSLRCSHSGGQVVWEPGLCGHQHALPGAAVGVQVTWEPGLCGHQQVLPMWTLHRSGGHSGSWRKGTLGGLMEGEHLNDILLVMVSDGGLWP